MAPIISTIEIARPVEEVFFYVIDPSRMHEWQQGMTSGGHMDGTPVHVGSHCTTVRKIGGAQRQVVTEITDYDPPRHWADHGIDGPIRAVVSVDVEALADHTGSRVTIAVDFEGHGIGKLLVPLVVRRSARREMPTNMQRLKRQLESGAAVAAP
jgi:uncharacterized protein YndB with AHSA1/START domain